MERIDSEEWRSAGRRHSAPADRSHISMPGDEAAVSDAEREAVLAEVRRQTVAGRLSFAEFSDRTDAALAAATKADLHAILGGVLREDQTQARRSARRGPWAYPPHPLIAFMIVLAILGLTGGHGWLLVPLIWLGVGRLRSRRWAHAVSARDVG